MLTDGGNKMNNVIVEKNGKSRYFYHKPLPLSGEYMPVPSSLPGCLFQAEIYYKFNQTEYATPPNFVEKIKKSSVVLISQNEFAVGLRYVRDEMNAPILIFKVKFSKKIIQLCNENHVPIEYNKSLTQNLYLDGEVGSEIPEKFYEVIASIFANLPTVALPLKPRDAEFFISRALRYFEKKKYSKALKDSTQAIRLDPNYAIAYYTRGAIYGAQEVFDKAIVDYTEAIRLGLNFGFDYAILFNQRGFAYLKLKEYDKAIADYTEAIRLEPDTALFYGNRGYTYAKQEMYDQAIADYTAALRLDPNDGDCAERIEEIKQQMGLTKKFLK
jgi:tetratricopeptide (TPR) repeat protein